jgi:serine O-acetyltransferase
MFDKLIHMNCHSKSKTSKWLARELLEKFYGCEINCDQIDKSVKFAHHARGCTIVAARILENAVIFQNVSIGANLRFNKTSNEWENVGTPIISANVIICDGAKIFGPIVIGENSVIGAGAIVTKSIPANSVVFGVNQCRMKDPEYDLVFRVEMINPEVIIEANRKLIEEFETVKRAE